MLERLTGIINGTQARLYGEIAIRDAIDYGGGLHLIIFHLIIFSLGMSAPLSGLVERR